jgi:hypothetical protein
LPVVQSGTHSQIVDAALSNSPLWRSVTILHLTQNMMFCSNDLSADSREEIDAFSKWLLDIDEGKIPSIAKDSDIENSWIRIPNDILLLPTENNLPCIIQSTYPDLQHKYINVEYLKERAILSTTNETVDALNDYILSFIPGNEKEYLSCDKIVKVAGSHESYDLLYPVKFLNSVDGNNFPQHRLLLKKTIPIMLVRNLNQSEGLCNGTRLVITSLGDKVIETEIMFGQHKGKRVLIPRITLTLKSPRLPFVLERRQYPIKVCYAMRINKSQGQTLAHVGIYLKKQFLHMVSFMLLSLELHLKRV